MNWSAVIAAGPKSGVTMRVTTIFRLLVATICVSCGSKSTFGKAIAITSRQAVVQIPSGPDGVSERDRGVRDGIEAPGKLKGVGDDARLVSAVRVAKNATIEGSVVVFDFYVENVGYTPLEHCSMRDDLDAVFGSQNYVVSAAPQVVEPQHNEAPSFATNPHFVGSGGITNEVDTRSRWFLRSPRMPRIH